MIPPAITVIDQQKRGEINEKPAGLARTDRPARLRADGRHGRSHQTHRLTQEGTSHGLSHASSVVGVLFPLAAYHERRDVDRPSLVLQFRADADHAEDTR